MSTAPRLGAWAVAATVAGNALEFYDFLTYSFFAVYIGRAFFPGASAFASLLLSLATFGVGFFTRPLGAVLIGAYADRAGRRPAMVLSFSLMTLGTLALVLTPPYAAIGIAAPLILVAARLVQGLALGGEVGPSTAVLLECAALKRRAALTSWQGASQGIAIFAAGACGVGLTRVLSPEQLGAWGWRLPFALGLLIVPVGLVLRRGLPETLEAPGTQGGAQVLAQLWREHRRSLGLGILVIMCLTISTYVNNYMTTYALTVLGMAASQSMWATLVNGAAMVLGSLAGGRLADRYGRRTVMIVPRVALMGAIVPAFLLLGGAKTPWVLGGVTATLTVLSSLSAAAATTAVIEAFPNAVRGSGMAIAYAGAVSVFGGTTQFIVAWLIGVTGAPLAPAYYVIATSIVGLWAMFRLPGPADARPRVPVAQVPAASLVIE